MSFTSTMWGKSKSGYNAAPYEGYSLNAPQFLPQSEKLTWDILSRRAQGEGVGFDPARYAALVDLTKSQLARQEEDQLSSAQGALSAAGLSGNPKAYEAMAGRVKRDTGRSLADELNKLNIEDLTRRNEERDINTGRLQNFYGQQVDQGSRKQQLDMNAWAQLERNKALQTEMDMQAASEQRNNIRGDISGGLGLLAGGFGGGGLASLAGSGKGLATQPTTYNYAQDFASNPYGKGYSNLTSLKRLGGR